MIGTFTMLEKCFNIASKCTSEKKKGLICFIQKFESTEIVKFPLIFIRDDTDHVSSLCDSISSVPFSVLQPSLQQYPEVSRGARQQIVPFIYLYFSSVSLLNMSWCSWQNNFLRQARNCELFDKKQCLYHHVVDRHVSPQSTKKHFILLLLLL